MVTKFLDGLALSSPFTFRGGNLLLNDNVSKGSPDPADRGIFVFLDVPLEHVGQCRKMKYGGIDKPAARDTYPAASGGVVFGRQSVHLIRRLS